MRMLFSSRPAFGHGDPMMPLAQTARRGGHEVVFATAGPFVAELRALDGKEEKGEDGRPDLDFGACLFIEVFGASTALPRT